MGLPWLVWLSKLSAGLQTKGLPVRFPVREHAWVVGLAPSWRHVRGSRSMYLLHIDDSLLVFLWSVHGILPKSCSCATCGCNDCSEPVYLGIK